MTIRPPTGNAHFANRLAAETGFDSVEAAAARRRQLDWDLRRGRYGDDRVLFYHATTSAAAERILIEGLRVGQGGESDAVCLAFSIKEAAGFACGGAEVVLRVLIPIKWMAAADVVVNPESNHVEIRADVPAAFIQRIEP